MFRVKFNKVARDNVLAISEELHVKFGDSENRIPQYVQKNTEHELTEPDKKKKQKKTFFQITIDQLATKYMCSSSAYVASRHFNICTSHKSLWN